MSSNNGNPTTSTTESPASVVATTTAVVTALPITVHTANSSPAFVNISVGELLQRQRRFTVVTLPPSRGVTTAPVTTMNRFPIKPDSRPVMYAGNRFADPSVRPQVPPNLATTPVVVNKMNKPPESFIRSSEGTVENSQGQYNIMQKPSAPEAVKEEPYQRVASSQSAPILVASQLDDLVRQIDPTSVLEEPVKTVLTEFVDDFVDQVIERSCKLARHRGSDTLEAKDVEFVLRRYFNCPPIPKSNVETFSKSETTENAQKNTEMAAHNQRMALIKKTLKKP